MNGGKDVRFGHDKRQVSIVPNSEQNLYNIANGEILTDEFGTPLITEVDTYYLPDATTKRSSSIVFDDTKSPYQKQSYQTIGISSASYITQNNIGISTSTISVGDFVSGPDIPDGTFVSQVLVNSILLSNNTSNTSPQTKNILIQRKNTIKAKSNPVWKIEEQFKETSEVSTTLLGVNRAETQLALFANVSSYGLDPDDFETYSFNSGTSFESWETRKNALFGNRYTATTTEETQESAVRLTAFPTPYSYPFGPKFEKLGLYDAITFKKYIDFIKWGNALYDYFDTGAGSSYPSGWKEKFLSSAFAYVSGGGDDVVYAAGIANSFAQIDTWTETWRDIRSKNLIDPTNGSVFDGSIVNGYSISSTQPGYSDRNRRYAYLQSRKVFRYQPGRISGFTFGLRSSVEPVTGITLEWGIANNSDQYIFQIDAGQFSIVRRSTVPLEPSVLIRNGLTLSDQTRIASGDPFDSELYWTIKIPDDKFNGDILNGNGPSGYNLQPQNVTMYKIEFGWYGAIGARFYAYIPTDNGDARWVVIHTLVIENSLEAPCLRDSYFRFKYSLNVANTGDVRTPQYIYKYGASYYIDGGDEGTSQIYSASSKQKTIKTTGSKSLIGISPKEYLLNREGVEIQNKKLIIPETLNVSTDSLTEVKVVTCKACPGFGHVYTPGVATTESGRYIDAVFDTTSSIVTVGSDVYFTKDDIGAKIIAPSIYNAYIYDVPESSRVPGTDNYIKAVIKRFAGTSGFSLETKPIAGELVLDRVLGITTTIGIGTTYPHQIRLSNYNATAASEFAFSGSKIEIQFVNPNNGDDYAHFADFLIGVTDKKPIVNIDTLSGFTLPGIGYTSILSNSQILYEEHTHSYAYSDENGVETAESWALAQPPLRMGIDYRIPNLSAPAGGVCSKVTVDVLDPLEIKNVNERNYPPNPSGTTTTDPQRPHWIEIAGTFPSIDFNGGQIAIRNTTNVNVGIVGNGLVMNLDAGNTSSYSGSGTTWADLSGNGNNETLVNSPTYSSANGGYFTFNGSTQYSSSSALSGSFTSFTVIVWFYPTSVTNYQNPIDCNYAYNGSTGNIGPRLEMTSSGTLAWNYSNATADNSSFYSHNVVSSGLAANTWHCAAITYDGNINSSTTYFNGKPTEISRTTYGEPTGFVGTVNNVTIGKGFHLGGAERLFAGRVSNVQIYNRALSATEVAQNYNALAGRYGLPLVATNVSIPTTETITITNSKFVGVTSSYTINDNGVEKEFSYIQISQSLGSVGSNFIILIRPVSITGTTISKQKLYNYNPWPLYVVAKLKDNAAINNISVKETIGNFQRTISPKWYVSSNCTVTTADGNADITGAAPTNFLEIDRSSSALIDTQNDQTLRPYIERDTLYVGANSTKTINMRKIFGPDRSVITPDNNNVEATFILAKKIDSGSTGIVEASINFKEQ